MAYSDFKTLDDVQNKLSVTISSAGSFFNQQPEAEVSTLLEETLKANVPIALNINTEKAGSELIVMPILVEIYKRFNGQIGLFSGIEFTVDAKAGLNGYCDFILSNAPNPIFITAPVVCMVEAKNENLKPAYPQCIAEMIAAQKFNAQQANPVETIWGVVTTGIKWRFLRLVGNEIEIDHDEYLIGQVGKILGIFQYILTV